jgi:hypothetical protein
MTEEEWDNSGNGVLLVEQLFGRVGQARKRRLFICACCRLLLSTKLKRVPEWIDIAERYADGLATEEDRRHANQSMRIAMSESKYRGHSISLAILHHAVLKNASHANMRNATHFSCQTAGMRINALCDVLRDIFGNPFRPVVFNSS